MLRLLKSRQILVTCLPTNSVQDTTGGVGRLPAGSPFTFKGTLLPPRRSLARTVSGVRLAVTWTLLPQGMPPVKEQDRLMFSGDERVFLITALKRYPRHLALSLELL